MLLDKICKEILGVEHNERFNVVSSKGKIVGNYYINCYGENLGMFTSITDTRADEVLIQLINEKLFIKKERYVPKNGDKYYCIELDSCFFKQKRVDDDFEDFINSNIFSQTNEDDIMRVKIGNCFKTEIDAAKQVVKFHEVMLKSDVVLDFSEVDVRGKADIDDYSLDFV